MDLKLDSATEEDIKNTFGDIEKDAEALVNYDNWLSIGLIYEGLKNYEGGNFAKGEMLDFFTEENDPEDSEIFMPMAAALSDGQRVGLPFVSLTQLLKFAFTSDEGWKESADEIKKEFEGLKDVSVYQNIDRDLYKEDGSVAMTDSAQRAENTQTGTTGTQEEQMDTLSMITAISWAATAGCALVTLGSLAARYHYINVDAIKEFFYEANFTVEGTTGYELVFMNEADLSFYSLDRATASAVHKARFAVQLSRIFMVVTLAVAVISTVLTIIDLCRDKSIEQLPIPKYLVDNYTDADGGSYTLNYKAVECNREEFFGADYTRQKGSSADLNADEGKQWLALYVSKNSKAGNPLTPDFAVQESSTAPGGYEGNVHIIGEKGAVNVASGAFRNYSTASQAWQIVAGDYTQFIFYKLSNDVKTYDEASGNMTASSFNGGTAALFGFGGLAIGAVLGAVMTSLVKKKKKAEA